MPRCFVSGSPLFIRATRSGFSQRRIGALEVGNKVLISRALIGLTLDAQK
jgi:hypothetical protein